MSTGAVSGMVQSGLLAQLVADSTATQMQLDKLTQQSASGQVADTYGGLGNTAYVSIGVRPQMAQVTAFQQNITTATTQLDTTQSVLGQLESIASTFNSDALGADMTTSTGATALAAQAQDALQQVAGLLNTQSNGQYDFAGTDSANPPISTANLATFTNAAGAQVSGLGSSTGATTLVSSLVTLATTANFAYPGSSAADATPTALLTPIGQGQNVPTAFVAGVNSYATQPGNGTTGSYVRDLIAGLAGLAGLSSTTADESTLQSYGSAVSQLLQGAATAITTEEAGFGQVQSDLSTQSTNLSDTLTSLTTQVSSVENVNMTATATALSQVQTQLQASYQLIAGLKELSLTDYL
jgi:flagellar hook-associated protein 3 FlgL